MPGTKTPSLNWKELDAVLAELSLTGCLVQDVHQPLHDTFVLSLYRPGPAEGHTHFLVLVGMSTQLPRIHVLTEKLPSPAKPFRFGAFLRAHIKGGRITAAGQVGHERVVRIDIAKGEQSLTLWLRLWGAAANALLTDAEGRILDAFYRRPKRGEISGGTFGTEQITAAPARAPKEYAIRELPGTGSFSERLEVHFSQIVSADETESARARLETELGIRESKVLSNLEKLEKRLSEYDNAERLKQFGDLITAAIHRIAKGDRWVKVEDFYNNEAPLEIELSPEHSAAQNAERYYERYRKARDGRDKVQEEIQHLRRMLAEIQRQREALTDAGAVMRAAAAPPPRKSAKTDDVPGLVFGEPPYRILVGRSSKENDELLRHAVRGNDWWFHARDFPGAYVFVKAPQGKSLPLEVMIDAATLAVHFSKGKSSGAGDVYYTQVKYLRRAKGAKRGLVIPTQEKNLRVTLDAERLQRLKGTDAP